MRLCLFLVLACLFAASNAIARSAHPGMSQGVNLFPSFTLPYHLELPQPRHEQPPSATVSVPQLEGRFPDPLAAAKLMHKGREIARSENPSAYLEAVECCFRPAVGKDPESLEARSLLALAYIRSVDFLPIDKQFLSTMNALLLPEPIPALWITEYASARAEFSQFLFRYEEAKDILDRYPRKVPQVAYQRASLALAMNQPAAAAEYAAKMDFENPRHFALAVKVGVKQYKDYRKGLEGYTSSGYAPGLLQFALDYASHNGPDRAFFLIALRRLIGSPQMLDTPSRNQVYRLAAEALLEAGELEQARSFLNENQPKAFFEIYLKAFALRAESTNIYSHILKGYQHANAGEWDKAIPHYIRGLELNRGDPLPFFLLGEAFEGKGEVFNALDRYQKAFSTPRRPEIAAIRAAEIYVKRWEFHKAMQWIQLAQRESSSSPGIEASNSVNFMKALLRLKEKKPLLAEPILERLASQGSRFLDLYLLLGKLAEEKKEAELAELFFAATLRYSPFHPEAMLGLALHRFHRQGKAKAVAFLESKLSHRPFSSPILTALAMVSLRAGDQPKGKKFLESAIRADKSYAEAFRLLGDLMKEEGSVATDPASKRMSYRYALASYEMFSKFNPLDPEGYMSTANLYFDVHDLNAAAKNYHKVLELTPNHPEVRLRLAKITRDGGDMDGALKLLEEEIQVNAQSDVAYLEKGNIMMSKKDFDYAQAAFTEATRINEKNSDAIFGLGVIHHLRGSYDNALSLFTKAGKLDPLKADIYWQMGLIYQKQKNYPKALQAFANYKGIAREPAAIMKAEDKLQEISGVPSAGPAYNYPRELNPFEILGSVPMEAERVGLCLQLGGKEKKCQGRNAKLSLTLPAGWKCKEESNGLWSCHIFDEAHAFAYVEIGGKARALRQRTERGSGGFNYIVEETPETLTDIKEILAMSHSFAEEYSRYESQPRFARKLKIAGHTWVDALHFNSYRPGFYSRYVATVEGDSSVLVAIHVKKERYHEVFTDTDQLVKGLRLQKIDPAKGSHAAER